MPFKSKLKSLYPDLDSKQIAFMNEKVKEQYNKKGRIGRGFLDKLKSALTGVKSVAKKVASKAVDIGLNKLQEVTNKGCTNPNPRWQYTPKKNPTEKHQIFLNNGCSYHAKFSGPGTHLIEDLKELLAQNNNNIQEALSPKNFASLVDLEALAHDSRYLLAQGNKQLVRMADEIFINVLSKMSDPNRLVPLAAMKAKIAAEDNGLVDVYTGNEKVSEVDKKLVEQVLAQLEQKGYGARRGGNFWDDFTHAVESVTDYIPIGIAPSLIYNSAKELANPTGQSFTDILSKSSTPILKAAAAIRGIGQSGLGEDSFEKFWNSDVGEYITKKGPRFGKGDPNSFTELYNEYNKGLINPDKYFQEDATVNPRKRPIRKGQGARSRIRETALDAEYMGNHLQGGSTNAEATKADCKISSWIAHVKAYALKHNINYRDALREARPSYRK